MHIIAVAPAFPLYAMDEFIFGTLATDELKLLYHRAEQRGLHHRYRLCPYDPLPGEAVEVAVTVGPDLSADHVACYYTLDGSTPAGSRGAATRGHAILLEQTGTGWDTPLWGYLTRWGGVIPGQPEGTVVRYRIGAWAGDGPETYADWPEVNATTEAASDAFFHNRPVVGLLAGDRALGTTFTYRVDRQTPPAWARDAVIYEVFVDRFSPGDGRSWQQTSDLRAFMGGTLWGVLDRLDYLQALGVNCLWLTPIFPSPGPHGYDTTDLARVDPRRGGDEALRALVGEAHRRGLRVLLDFVCNHLSSEHPLFVEARSDPASPYRSWFQFDGSAGGYRMFSSVPTMPQINTAADGARRWLIETAQFWLREFGIDGFRLDHAHGPGPDFWADFWAACKDVNPDCLCFGEVVDKPEVIRHYVGRLDGCLDFMTANALRNTFGRGTWSADDYARFLARHADFFPAAGFVMPTFLDNHDMDRLLFLARGDKGALRRAIAAQMRLPGPPVIYYGTEVGLSQDESTRGPLGLVASRKPMPWGADQDRALYEFVQAQIAARRSR